MKPWKALYITFFSAGIALSTVPQAQADGMPERYSAPVAVATYNWSGLYAGGGIGWIGTDVDWSFNPAISGAPHQAYSLSSDRFAGELHVGYQQQFGSLLLGIEGSVISAGGKANDHRFGDDPTLRSEAHVSNIYTAGGRIGWIFSPQWMLYGGGGYANAALKSTALSATSGSPSLFTEERHDGWYAGGGLEFALNSNVIFGVDYKHIEFDSKRHCPIDIGCAAGALDHSIRDLSANADVVLARLTFKLGRETTYAPLK